MNMWKSGREKRNWKRAWVPHGNVDIVTSQRVSGWAFASGGIEVEAYVNGVCVARTRPNANRPDVRDVFPHAVEASQSGFTLDVPRPNIADLTSELKIVARPIRRWMPSKILASQTIFSDSIVRTAASAPDAKLQAPFPKQVVDAVVAIWPNAYDDFDKQEGEDLFLERLLLALDNPQLKSLATFSDYARYLSATLAHCRFVERYFPVTNSAARHGANDFHCKPNSVDELFSIIHHLYVLKSWGVEGDFAEFGCFKGYSSSMLSFACAQLGIKMHIFDSFAGLPPAPGSGYEEGEYSGDFNEVSENIRQFGSLDVVEFHPGFFSESLLAYRPPPLMCLWMDVDLELSAKDLLVVADNLDPRGSVFSHECTADIFRNGHINTSPRPDNPIFPLVERHTEMGRTLTGHHVAGYTGAFWPAETGIPVLNSTSLRKLMQRI